jgi:hypothetical protein
MKSKGIQVQNKGIGMEYDNKKYIEYLLFARLVLSVFSTAITHSSGTLIRLLLDHSHYHCPWSCRNSHSNS